MVALLFFCSLAFAADVTWTDWTLQGAQLDSDGVLTVVAPTNGEAAAAWQAWPDLNLSHHGFSISLQAADWTKVATVELVLSAAGNFDEYFSVDLRSRLVLPPAGTWLELPVPHDAWRSSPGARWNRINAAVLRVQAVEGSLALVQVRDLSHQLRAFSEGFVTIAFDDGWQNTHDVAWPLLEDAGLHATAYVIPSLLGAPDHLTQQQVDDLHDAGWDISGHSDGLLTLLSAAELDAELKAVSDYLRQHDYRGAEHYAYPNGAFNERVLAATGRYFETGRSINPYAQLMNQPVPLELSSISVYPEFSQQELENMISSAVRNGEWLIITFHRLAAEPEFATEFPVQDFSSMITYLLENDVAVLTVSEAWDMLAALQSDAASDCVQLPGTELVCN